MRAVIWTDQHGYKHKSLVRDTDPDEAAPTGIPREPPSVAGIDWEQVRRELHNGLVEMDVFTWRDIQRHNQRVTGLILGVLRRQLIMLYRQQELQEVEANE